MIEQILDRIQDRIEEFEEKSAKRMMTKRERLEEEEFDRWLEEATAVRAQKSAMEHYLKENEV